MNKRCSLRLNLTSKSTLNHKKLKYYLSMAIGISSSFYYQKL